MGMRLVEISEKDKFNKMTVHPLQSWEWGDFRKNAGNEVIRFVNAHKNTIINSYQLLIHHVPYTKFKIGTLIKCPKPTKELFQFLQKLAKEHNLIFIKLEPNVVINSKLQIQKLKSQFKSKNDIAEFFQKNNCIPGKTLFTPTSFWIDLTKPESELLKSFSSKTRYNIRLAEKHGVRVVEDNSKERFEKYLELTFETAKRQGFYAHSEKYHRLMWQHLNEEPIGKNLQPIAHLLTANYQGETITTWILFVWKDFLYYPYGASSDKYRNVMANNLIMWEAIKFGKKNGLKTFDLWGREENKGFTKFKEGYNPQVVEFLGSWDMMVNKPLYYSYRILEYLRWKFLKFPSKIKNKLKI